MCNRYPRVMLGWCQRERHKKNILNSMFLSTAKEHSLSSRFWGGIVMNILGKVIQRHCWMIKITDELCCRKPVAVVMISIACVRLERTIVPRCSLILSTSPCLLLNQIVTVNEPFPVIGDWSSLVLRVNYTNSIHCNCLERHPWWYCWLIIGGTPTW